MCSVERVLDYANLSEEKVNQSDEGVGQSWRPMDGEIEFKNASFSYDKTLPDVLKGLTFRIKAGEKIGIVGRTSAGKSTIMRALFRMCAQTSGSILIDNVDIRKISLHSLRNSFAFIPVLFFKIRKILEIKKKTL